MTLAELDTLGLLLAGLPFAWATFVWLIVRENSAYQQDHRDRTGEWPARTEAILGLDGLTWWIYWIFTGSVAFLIAFGSAKEPGVSPIRLMFCVMIGGAVGLWVYQFLRTWHRKLFITNKDGSFTPKATALRNKAMNWSVLAIIAYTFIGGLTASSWNEDRNIRICIAEGSWPGISKLKKQEIEADCVLEEELKNED